METAVVDDMKDDSKESGDVLSPEDVAWADSCLMKDIATLANGLDSSEHALPEPVPSRARLSAITRDNSPQEPQIFPTIEETLISGILDDTIDDVTQTNEQGEGDTNSTDAESLWSRINSENVFLPTYEDQRLSVDYVTQTNEQGEGDTNSTDTESLWSRISSENVFLPTYNEDQSLSVDDVTPTTEQGEGVAKNIDARSFWSRMNSENVFRPAYNEELRLCGLSKSEADSDFPTFVEENSAEDIFKVWELDIPDEEDELLKQLNKAFEESSLEPSPSISDTFRVQDTKLLDDVISGITDLSLSSTTD